MPHALRIPGADRSSASRRADRSQPPARGIEGDDLRRGLTDHIDRAVGRHGQPPGLLEAARHHRLGAAGLRIDRHHARAAHGEEPALRIDGEPADRGDRGELADLLIAREVEDPQHRPAPVGARAGQKQLVAAAGDAGGGKILRKRQLLGAGGKGQRLPGRRIDPGDGFLGGVVNRVGVGRDHEAASLEGAAVSPELGAGEIAADQCRSALGPLVEEKHPLAVRGHGDRR